MKKLIDILPKISQWESIKYSPDLDCKNGCSGFVGSNTRPNLIGWCDTPNGYQIVFECPVCFSKFRFHGSGSSNKFDITTLEHAMQRYLYSCLNKDELLKKLKP